MNIILPLQEIMGDIEPAMHITIQVEFVEICLAAKDRGSPSPYKSFLGKME